jgi:hypothetical protein
MKLKFNILRSNSADCLEQTILGNRKRFPPNSARALRETAEPFFPKPIAMFQQIHTYAELLQQIHDDLRIQHPEWVEPSGESPMCDAYEERLMELLDAST